MTLDDLVRRLRAYSYRGVSEALFHDEVTAALDIEGVVYQRERVVGPRNRLDFYLPGWRAALELKIDGSNSAVLRQIHRYAQLADVDHVILMTKHARHRGLPRLVGGKPVHVVYLWEGALR